MSDIGKSQIPLLRTRNLTIASIAGAALYYLWIEHYSHLVYFLPYLIFLLCPFMHFFMHREHKHDNDGSHSPGQAVSEAVDESNTSCEQQRQKNNAANIKIESLDRE
jgi:hypothetical protein